MLLKYIIGCIKASKLNKSLGNPISHASRYPYRKILKNVYQAGMLPSLVVAQEEKSYFALRDTIQLTLFSVTKSSQDDWLISWLKIQNHFLPHPSYTSVPDPSLLDSLEAKTSLSAVYFSVANMFHNTALPISISKMFLLPTVRLNQLP